MTTLNTKSASKKSKTKISIADSTELHRLKKTINTSAEAVESLVKSVKDKSRQALAEALIAGAALAKVKTIIGYGGFGKWLKENCKAITEKTAQKYMQLANRGSELMGTGLGLRQAYIALGILKEDDSETSLSNDVGDASLAGTIRMKANKVNKVSVTPLANQMARANGNHAVSIITPEISSEDHLSRARYLTQQLLGELNSKITIKGITLSDLEKETLNQIAAWFKQQRA